MALFNKLKQFVLDVRQEMSKVSWPTREQLKGSTGAVIAFSLIFATYTFVADQILQYLVTMLLTAN